MYGNQEEVNFNIYGGKVPIHFPTHTLSDYLSPTFFQHFCLEFFEEEKSPEEFLDEYKTPGLMGIVAKKR